MTAWYVYNKATGENSVFYGYTLADMQRRYNDVNWMEWEILDSEYVD